MSSSKVRHLVRWFSNAIVGKIPSRFLRHLWYGLFIDIGTDANIMTGFRFRHVGRIKIGATTNINCDCMFDSRGGEIVIGNYVDIAPEVNIWTLEHDPQDPEFGTKGGDVHIGDYAWICNRAIILPDTTIGRGAIVASGAVVISDVEPWTIVGGVPAKKIGERNRDQKPRKPYRPFLL